MSRPLHSWRRKQPALSNTGNGGNGNMCKTFSIFSLYDKLLDRTCSATAMHHQGLRHALLHVKAVKHEFRHSREFRNLTQRLQVFETSVKTLWHHNTALAANLERDLEHFLGLIDVGAKAQDKENVPDKAKDQDGSGLGQQRLLTTIFEAQIEKEKKENERKKEEQAKFNRVLVQFMERCSAARQRSSAVLIQSTARVFLAKKGLKERKALKEKQQQEEVKLIVQKLGVEIRDGLNSICRSVREIKAVLTPDVMDSTLTIEDSGFVRPKNEPVNNLGTGDLPEPSAVPGGQALTRPEKKKGVRWADC